MNKIIKENFGIQGLGREIRGHMNCGQNSQLRLQLRILSHMPVCVLWRHWFPSDGLRCLLLCVWSSEGWRRKGPTRPTPQLELRGDW